ncbi:hypothetical protein G6F32_016537 [Rhizopus arrhizus]|nr:hypothetical protein G6F32_016537 [Rhizopus arrhizus]
MRAGAPCARASQLAQQALEGLRGDLHMVLKAVPIIARSGRVIAAMNVSGHSNRFSREAMLEAFLPPLRHAADQINHALLRR